MVITTRSAKPIHFTRNLDKREEGKSDDEIGQRRLSPASFVDVLTRFQVMLSAPSRRSDHCLSLLAVCLIPLNTSLVLEYALHSGQIRLRSRARIISSLLLIITFLNNLFL